MIKTFRGLIADGATDTILLHTNDGSTGYRIVKFQVLGESGNTAMEGTVQIFKVNHATMPEEIDFSDNTLLAAAIIQQSTSTQGSAYDAVIFDNEIFNQDIYIFHDEKSAGVGNPANYYLELEQVKLDINSNTVATLKDMRNTATPNPG